MPGSIWRFQIRSTSWGRKRRTGAGPPCRCRWLKSKPSPDSSTPWELLGGQHRVQTDRPVSDYGYGLARAGLGGDRAEPAGAQHVGSGEEARYQVVCPITPTIRAGEGARALPPPRPEGRHPNRCSGCYGTRLGVGSRRVGPLNPVLGVALRPSTSVFEPARGLDRAAAEGPNGFPKPQRFRVFSANLTPRFRLPGPGLPGHENAGNRLSGPVSVFRLTREVPLKKRCWCREGESNPHPLAGNGF